MTKGYPCHVAYLTAGAAGTYCGSCMHDNTLVRALRRDGMSALLVPTYTPIRTDDPLDVSDHHVFLGGIHVYLNQRFPWLRRLPRLLTGWLDLPSLLRWGTSRGISIRPTELGELTLSLLKGEQGEQAAEFARLAQWLESEARPHIVHYTNLLIGGTIPTLKQRLGVPIIVTLQGDDTFLNGLLPPFRDRAWRIVRQLATHVDQFISYSQDYAELMSHHLDVPRDKICVVPLGIDADAIASEVGPRSSRSVEPRRIGYLARLCPEKGLHILIESFQLLRQLEDMHDVELHIAGWQGADQTVFVQQQFGRIRDAGLSHAVHHHGSVDRSGKTQFLRMIDLFSVPATYREPKGLYVVEALAAGLPVVQPHRGSFPEIIANTGGGFLVPPDSPDQLAATWAHVLRLPDRGQSLGAIGQKNALKAYGLDALSRGVRDVYARLIAGPRALSPPPSG